ncbi:hypothetical protein [Dysgonomonas sp. GY617]|uniref:hypothetical protein n=1 Tax=Dysgonomonas sp. GY617 TaxID=2780420 RepID=UPI001F54F011|nr:hypothetical protein [Dysgonomonas sp. GY617]
MKKTRIYFSHETLYYISHPAVCAFPCPLPVSGADDKAEKERGKKAFFQSVSCSAKRGHRGQK